MSDDAENARLRAEILELKAQLARTDRSPDASRWLLIGAGAIILILLLALCTRPSGDSGQKSAASADSPSAAASLPSESLPPEAPPKPPEPEPVGQQWIYRVDEDPMGGGTKTACVTSDDSVSLSAPYEPQPMMLCLRQSSKFGLDAFVRLTDSGQILCNSYSKCHVRVRFDDAPAQSWSGTDASDGSSEIVFLQRTATLIGKIKAARVVRVELEFYRNGVQSVTFQVEGLTWPPKEPAG